MTKINEIGRMVINFTKDAPEEIKSYTSMFHNCVAFLTLDRQEEKEPQWNLCFDRINWEYSLVDSLCSTHCIAVERGDRTVNGKAIKPEKYLPLWRQAMANPLSVAQARAMGITVMVHIRRHQPKIRSVPNSEKLVINWLEQKQLIESQNEAYTVWKVEVKDFASMIIASQINNEVDCKYGEGTDNATRASVLSSYQNFIQSLKTEDLFDEVTL